MYIERIVLREVAMKLVAPFETSFGATHERRILLVEAEVIEGAGVSARTVSGWGEVTAGETPFYSPETTDTAWHILSKFIWPALKGKNFSAAAEVWPMLSQIRGHNMARAGLETALWDAEAKLKNIPLWKLLGGTREEIATGLSIGIKPTVEELLGAVARGVSEGYQRIKVKIKPGWDVNVIEKIREQHPMLRLMADANSAYTLADAAHLKQLDRFNLMMIEQPLGWDDLFSHVKLQRQLQTPICLDECIHTIEQAEAAIESGACKIINIKLGRVGGHAVARRMQALCMEKGVPTWCGGMLESGIGRTHNIAMSSQSGFVLPGDVAASRRYWKEDVIEPEVVVSPQGTIRMPAGPGIGFEVKKDFLERFEVQRAVLI